METKREREKVAEKRRHGGREKDKTEPVTLDERPSHCGLQLGMAGGRA